MTVLKCLDWHMISFVGVSLINEYVKLPQIYYWNGRR
jgi:hypothetical protein